MQLDFITTEVTSRVTLRKKLAIILNRRAK